MKDTGSAQSQFTSEVGVARRPSICNDGRRTFYDVDGDLYYKNNSGGAPQLVLDNDTNCSGGNCCYLALDVDCGRTVGGNPRVVYTCTQLAFGFPLVQTSNIYMAEWNQSLQTLENKVALTVDPQEHQNNDPAWCGNDYVVWAHLDLVPPPAEVGYEYQICVMDVSSGGPGGVTCYKDDEINDRHPSCRPDAAKIAWAREKEGYGSGHKLCVMDFDGTNEECTSNSHPDYYRTRPSWSPSGLQIAYASNEPWEGSTDYEIWAINADNLGMNPAPLTNNVAADDDDPDWGGALLGP